MVAMDGRANRGGNGDGAWARCEKRTRNGGRWGHGEDGTSRRKGKVRTWASEHLKIPTRTCEDEDIDRGCGSGRLRGVPRQGKTGGGPKYAKLPSQAVTNPLRKKSVQHLRQYTSPMVVRLP